MRRTNRITALVMLAALVAVAVGVAVWPTPEEAKAAVQHTLQVVDSDLQPLVGYDVSIWIQTGANDWTEFQGVTDGNGEFIINETPHTTATFWVASVTDEQWLGDVNNLDTWQIWYPTTFYQAVEQEP